jgi:hypothetical protein
MEIPIVYLKIAERFAREYGEPIPREMLTIGGETGWKVRLNAALTPQDDINPFAAHVYWNGWFAGIIDGAGGVIAAGNAANEDALIAWLQS